MMGLSAGDDAQTSAQTTKEAESESESGSIREAAEPKEVVASAPFADARADCGKNAVVYGPGSYFARDASYSASDTYSPKDANGHKRMFLCRLALGSYAVVNPGYTGKEPPVRDAERVIGVGQLLHDTTTNNDIKKGVPQIMVAYKDNQAVSDYLVTFAWK